MEMLGIVCGMALVVLTFVADISSGLVIQSTWSHIRFKSLPPARIDARFGGDLVIECSVSGSPSPQVSWYKDDMFISHRDWSIENDISSIGVSVARLKISCLTEKDVGTYECRSRAGHHELSSVTVVNVVPNEVPHTRCVMTGRPEIAIWKETLMVEEGDTARLPCSVQDSALDYRITWTNTDGENTLSEQHTKKFIVEPNGDLVIKDVSFAEMGRYTCTVSGTGGTQSIHTFLYPLSRSRNSLN